MSNERATQAAAQIKVAATLLAMYFADHLKLIHEGTQWQQCDCDLCNQYLKWIGDNKELLEQSMNKGGTQ